MSHAEIIKELSPTKSLIEHLACNGGQRITMQFGDNRIVLLDLPSQFPGMCVYSYWVNKVMIAANGAFIEEFVDSFKKLLSDPEIAEEIGR